MTTPCRAFDANKDDRLSFKEWQVGFYLLILLPKVLGHVEDANGDNSNDDDDEAVESGDNLLKAHSSSNDFLTKTIKSNNNDNGQDQDMSEVNREDFLLAMEVFLDLL